MRHFGRLSITLSLLLALELGLAGASKIGYPCTQYKPADIARAKANIAQFEWARKIHDSLKETAAYYLGMDRKTIRSLISDKTPLVAIKCPVCGKAPWSFYNLLEGGAVSSARTVKPSGSGTRRTDRRRGTSRRSSATTAWNTSPAA